MIQVKGLYKKYQNFFALNGLDLHVKKGEIYGFIGRNGAGKTTAMNIFAGLSKPTKGQCIVNRKNISSINNPGDLKIGYLPEEPKFYSWMTAYEILEYLSNKPDNLLEILTLIGLKDSSNRRVGSFSRGMKQRLGIGATLINNPDLLILDEPSSALDPKGRSEVLNLIKEVKDMGKTVILSTHILDDVERVCDRIGYISDGKMVFEKPLIQIQKENIGTTYDIVTINEINKKTINNIKSIPNIVMTNISEKSITVSMDQSISIPLMKVLVDNNIVIESFNLRKSKIEDIFLQEVEVNDK